MEPWKEGRTAPPADVIARWAKAYLSANGEAPNSTMAYERGWFILRSPYTARFRRLQVLDMIDRLETRALPAPDDGSHKP